MPAETRTGAYNVLIGISEEKGHLQDLDVGGTFMLK